MIYQRASLWRGGVLEQAYTQPRNNTNHSFILLYCVANHARTYLCIAAQQLRNSNLNQSGGFHAIHTREWGEMLATTTVGTFIFVLPLVLHPRTAFFGVARWL